MDVPDADRNSSCEEADPGRDAQHHHVQEEVDSVTSWWLNDEVSSVRAVQKDSFPALEDHLKIEIIPDSGADVSLLPLHHSPGGSRGNKKNFARLQDAQGNKIMRAGKQIVSLILFDD